MLEERRHRAALKIPKNLPQVVVKNKPILKAIAIYLELKPLYYSGVIKNAKVRNREISDFLDISPRTLHTHISWLRKNKIAWYDAHKDLYLCSYEKFCNKINSIFKSKLKYRRKCYELSNDGLTEYAIRALAIHESRMKQNEAAKAKVFSKEKYEDRVFSDMNKGIVPKKAWTPYHQDVTKYTYLNKSLRREKRMCLFYYTDTAPEPVNLLWKYQNFYKARMRSGDDAEINPYCTLSCAGVARVFKGSDSPATGHYWEKRLEQLGFLHIKPHHIRLERTSGYYRGAIRGNTGYYDPYKEERVPIYTRKKKYGETMLFRTLPNQLFPLLNMSQTVAGVQLRLIL